MLRDIVTIHLNEEQSFTAICHKPSQDMANFQKYGSQRHADGSIPALDQQPASQDTREDTMQLLQEDTMQLPQDDREYSQDELAALLLAFRANPRAA